MTKPIASPPSTHTEFVHEIIHCRQNTPPSPHSLSVAVAVGSAYAAIYHAEQLVPTVNTDSTASRRLPDTTESKAPPRADSDETQVPLVDQCSERVQYISKQSRKRKRGYLERPFIPEQGLLMFPCKKQLLVGSATPSPAKRPRMFQSTTNFPVSNLREPIFSACQWIPTPFHIYTFQPSPGKIMNPFVVDRPIILQER